MNFGQAIEALKNSKKVARKGWNGKEMFVYYVPAGNFKSYTEIGKSIADGDDLVHYSPYFAIKNVNETVSTWVPSINDCLAEDWYGVAYGSFGTMSMAEVIKSIEREVFREAQSHEIGGRNGEPIDCSTLEDEPVIEADNEADRQALRDCFKE